MDTKEIKLDDGTILKPVEPLLSDEQSQKLSEMINSPEYKNYAANQMKEQLYKNLGFNEKPNQPKNVMVEKQTESTFLHNVYLISGNTQECQNLYYTVEKYLASKDTREKACAIMNSFITQNNN